MTYTTADDTERAAFEAWMRDEYFNGLAEAGPYDEARGLYKQLETHMAWCGFRAGRASLASPPEPVAMIGSGWQLLWVGGNDHAAHVRKHGLRIGSMLYAALPAPAPQLEPVNAQPDFAELLPRLDNLADWLDSSANLGGGGPDHPPEPASQFDYELCQAASELRLIRAAIAAAEAAQPEPGPYAHWCRELVAAMKRLSFAAQTTGGTAGPDAELQAAIAQAEEAMSLCAASRACDAAQPEPAAVPVKRWPFVETPGDFAARLAAAVGEFGELLAAVRHVLIENPPTLAAHHTPQPAPAGVVEALRALLDMDVAYKRGPAVEQAVEVARAALAAADAALSAPVQTKPGPHKCMPYDPTPAMLTAAREIDPALPIEHIRRLWWLMWRAAQAAPVQAVPLTNQDEWQSAVFTLMGHAAGLYAEGKQDMPAWFYELAEKIARTHLDEAAAQRVRQVAEKVRAHGITGDKHHG